MLMPWWWAFGEWMCLQMYPTNDHGGYDDGKYLDGDDDDLWLESEWSWLVAGGAYPWQGFFHPARAASKHWSMQWEMESLASQCNATLLLASSSCLQRVRRQPAAREHFPLGAQPYSFFLSLSPWFVHWALWKGTEYYGKALMPSALHKMPTGKATLHPIRAKRGCYFCQICSCIVLLLLFSCSSSYDCDCFFSQLCWYATTQFSVTSFFVPSQLFLCLPPAPQPEFYWPSDGLHDNIITLFHVSECGHCLQSLQQSICPIVFLMECHVIVGVGIYMWG